jgi:hypothetical protein
MTIIESEAYQADYQQLDLDVAGELVLTELQRAISADPTSLFPYRKDLGAHLAHSKPFRRTDGRFFKLLIPYRISNSNIELIRLAAKEVKAIESAGG